MTKKITIIGGGYAGNMLAQKLDQHADVTLIEPREKWVHNVAMIRSLATPELMDEIIIPYDNLLKKGRVIRARAKALDGTTVILEDDTRVDGDICVVATGSSYAAPFKMQDDDIEGFLRTVRKIIGQIEKAKNIVIVGAGAVGTELSGELAIGRPDKNITLVSSDLELFPDYPKRLGQKLKRQLAELDVKLRLGERVADLKQSDAPFVPAKKKLKLSDGFPIDADLVIPVIGSKPNTDLIQTVPGVELDTNGRVQTDDWLRPSDSPSLFVVGDIASTGDTMTVVGLTRQVEWLDRILRSFVAGRPIERARPYRPWPKSLILLPLGPDKGASALPFGVVGPFLTSKIKGQKLFIPRYHKEFGWKPDGKS